MYDEVFLITPRSRATSHYNPLRERGCTTDVEAEGKRNKALLSAQQVPSGAATAAAGRAAAEPPLR
jgi:hypothetical protein